MKGVSLLALAGTIWACTAVGAAADGGGSAPPRAVGALGTHGLGQSASPFTSLGRGNLVYHGGSLETASTNYLVFWEPGGQDTVLASYNALIEQFFTDIGGSPLYGVATQYGVTNSATLGGVYVDTSAYPIRVSPGLTDADIRNEVLRAEAVNGWTGGVGHELFVITEPGELTCRFGSSCSGIDFCGYHDTIRDQAGLETAYADIPYPDTIPDGCTSGYVPNLVPGADDAINIISHELMESVTDPGIGIGDGGWSDAAGYEIGDKCAWIFGPQDSTGADMYINGHPYVVQEEYSNAISDCSMS